MAKKSKTTGKDAGFRIRLETKDGVLVANREGMSEYWHLNGRIDTEFANYSLGIECREHGVKLISYSLESTGIVAKVEWK